MACYEKGSDVELDLGEAIKKAQADGLVLDYRENTKSFKLPDFWVLFNPDRINVSGLSDRDRDLILRKAESGAWLEAKVRSRYDIKNWPGFAKMGIKESDAFIEDDLTIRRLEYCGDGLSKYIVVGTNDGRIVVYPAAVLNRLSLVRLTNRKQQNSDIPKGKWLLSLEWGGKCKSMEAVLELALASYRQGAEWAGVLDSVKAPIDIEMIDDFQGIIRTQEHRNIDLEDKR